MYIGIASTVEPQGKREGHSCGRMQDVSTAAKWGTSQTAAPNQRNKIRPDYLQWTYKSLTPLDNQDPSPESDDEGDPVDGPQYSSDEGDVIDIYDDDGDSDGEPVACLGQMYTHDPHDEEVVYCSSMTARDRMDVCIERCHAPNVFGTVDMEKVSQ